MESAKINIKKIVSEYIKLCPEEYTAFKEQMKTRRQEMVDEKFGQAKNTDSGMRALFEMPATLHEMLVHNLTQDQLEWFKKGGENGLEGGRWFANTFREFTLPKHV